MGFRFGRGGSSVRSLMEILREQTRKNLGGQDKETEFYPADSPWVNLHTNPEGIIRPELRQWSWTRTSKQCCLVVGACWELQHFRNCHSPKLHYSTTKLCLLKGWGSVTWGVDSIPWVWFLTDIVFSLPQIPQES